MIHKNKIKIISKLIEEKYNRDKPIMFAKKSVSHVVPTINRSEQSEKRIDIGSLTEIIEVDTKNKICIAESGVTFSDLVKTTLKSGLIPYVVPELKTITIGGAVSGCSVESMSYKYGGFHDSCLEYEILTSSGEVINCSKTENSDIFEMIHGSYGTLGLVTKLKFKLYPAKHFIKMNYVKFSEFDKFWEFMTKQCTLEKYTFIDAIIHSKDSLVACMGTMVDEAPYVSSYEKLNIFYKSTSEKNEDYLNIYEYFFRYDSDCHWLTKTMPLLENKLIRLVFGGIFLGSTKLIKLARLLKPFLKLKFRPDIVIDVFIPSKKFPNFWKWYLKEFDFFPLWIVPYKIPGNFYPWINTDYKKSIQNDFLIDCAIYGKSNNDKKIDYSKLLEEKVFELGGIKTLISQNNYTKKRFNEIYNEELYNKIKKRTDPKNSFGTVFNKMCKL